jgi:hypothetical protein
MNSHNDYPSVPTPNGYDSQLLEVLENPFLVGLSDEEDHLDCIVRVDGSHSFAGPVRHRYF